MTRKSKDLLDKYIIWIQKAEKKNRETMGSLLKGTPSYIR